MKRRFLKIGPNDWFNELHRHVPDYVVCDGHDGYPETLPEFENYEYVIVHHEYVRRPGQSGLRDRLCIPSKDGSRPMVAVHDPEPGAQRSPHLHPMWAFFAMPTDEFGAIADSVPDLFKLAGT